ncbi:MAG: ABC transporter ATP-binding protein [Gammaproteobacteria bacterium]|nr:ABC transporter ATP-binding protein [Gammaproteobacteria bacterium]
MTNRKQTAGVVIESLGLSFGETEVLRGVDLTIEPGEFFSFLGPSGSGKSTLLRAIAGFGPTPTGRILISGENIAQLPPWKRDVGMVFQSYALWPHMTVRKNVAFGLEERKVEKSKIDKRVDKALDMVGLLELADRRPAQLSGGQQQRIALARTLVVEPKVLLLDEPLSNLDANLRVQMRRDIRELQRELNLTTIFVTHDQEEANTTSDRMAVLNQGIIQQVGTPMALYDNPTNLFVAHFLGTANVLSGVVLIEDGRTVFRSHETIEIPLNPQKSGERSIVLRPQNIDVCIPGKHCSETQTKLMGHLQHMEFLGSVIRYAVNVEGITLLVDHPHKQGEVIFQPGDAIQLLIELEHILVLAA